MAKIVPDDQNRFRQTWGKAREQGVSRQVMADSLGIDRGRLNDLIIGRAKPRLAEAAALSGRRRATLVRYKDETGARHSFYTGRGMSYERLIETEAMVELADEMSDREHYADFDHIVGMENRYPARPTETRIYSVSRSLRRELGG